MQKQMSSKKIMMISCAAAAVVAAVVVILLLSRKEEAFRSILVYELEGSAVIERADIGTIDAVENLYLESGDRVSVQPESLMRMKLDDDKYITAEADTVFLLEAEGDGQDSKTRICLEKGAVTNEIQNPLSGESVYETSTPNSVMAVRGTIYRAELYDDGEGGQDMRLCCFQGTVAARPILPDGTLGEEVLVGAGAELTVYSDGSVDGPTDIDFESLPDQALRTLKDLLDSGASVTGITEEDFARLGQDAAQLDFGKSETSEVEAGKELTVVEHQDAGDQNVEDPKTEDEQTGEGSVAERKGQSVNPKQTAGSRQTAKDTGKDGNTPGSEAVQQPKNTPPAAGNTSGTSDKGNSEGGNDQNTDSGNASNDGKDEKPGDNSGGTPNKPSKEVIYTVTYRYQGSVFATQNVKKGNKTSAPVLTPEAEGAWDFDFGTKIKADTIIEWKSGN